MSRKITVTNVGRSLGLIIALLGIMHAPIANADTVSVQQARVDVFRHTADPATHNALAVALDNSKQYAEALSEANLAVKFAPTVPLYRQNLAEILIDCGKLKLAAVEFSALVKAAPDDIPSWIGLAHVSQALGQDASAVSCFQNAEALDPLDFNTHSELAGLFMSLGQFSNAEPEYKYCLCIRSADYDSTTFLATAQSEQKKTDSAVATLLGALALPGITTDQQSRADVQLGAIYLAAGQTATAIDSLKTAEALTPGDPQVHNALGAALYTNGDKQAALTEWKIALASHDQDAKQTAKLWLSML